MKKSLKNATDKELVDELGSRYKTNLILFEDEDEEFELQFIYSGSARKLVANLEVVKIRILVSAGIIPDVAKYIPKGVEG